MKIQTIHRNQLGQVFNETSATGIRIDGPDGERFELRIVGGKVQIGVTGFAMITGHRRGDEAWVNLLPASSMGPTGRSPTSVIVDEVRACYQCGRETTWLAPDSRCGNCTRLTVDEVRGS